MMMDDVMGVIDDVMGVMRDVMGVCDDAGGSRHLQHGVGIPACFDSLVPDTHS